MKTLTTTIFLLLSLFSFAQEDAEGGYIDIGPEYGQEPETFAKPGYHHGGVFGADVHYTQIEGENAIVTGFKAAYIMNRSIELGAAGYGIYSELDHPTIDGAKMNILGGYGGFHCAPVIMPLKKVHFAVPIMLGAGAIGYDEDFRFNDPGEFNFANDWDEIFVAQVGLNVVFNITNFFQIEAGARYLQTTNIELDLVDDLDISGFSGGFGLRFGWF